MPQAAQFHRIRKQAKTPNGSISASCSEVGKNRLTSVGFIYFERTENNKGIFVWTVL